MDNQSHPSDEFLDLYIVSSFGKIPPLLIKLFHRVEVKHIKTCTQCREFTTSEKEGFRNAAGSMADAIPQMSVDEKLELLRLHRSTREDSPKTE